MLIHPDFSKPFNVHVDLSDYQLGRVVSQHGKLITFFSTKFNQAQKQCPITEKIADRDRNVERILLLVAWKQGHSLY